LGVDFCRGAAPAIVAVVSLEVYGTHVRCLGLERLIHVKRAAGRPKDFEAIAELEALREEQQGSS
jgi:predicted nucleotidyltransferase